MKEVYEASKKIQEFSVAAKAPSQEVIKQLNTLLVERVNKHNIKAYLDKPETKVLSKPIVEGITTFFWVLNDNPKQLIETCIEASEYHVNTLRKQKV